MEVETLHGSDEVEIPPGTGHGREFRIPGKGISRLDGRGMGDHIVQVQLHVPHPKNLSDIEVELLRQLAEEEGKQVREDRGVFNRVRDLFG